MTDIVTPLKLRNGAGGNYANGLCVMEAVAWMASEGATDTPKCACPVLGKFAIRLNDWLNDENRQHLKALILPLTGTRSPAHEQARAEYLVIQITNRIVSQVFHEHFPEHARALREAKTIAEVSAAAYAANAAAKAANAAAYAAKAANAAAKAAKAAAYAANSAAYAAAYAANGAANAANAAAYAAYAAACQSILLQCIPILREAIMLGPNAADQWETYEPRAKALAEFLEGVG